MPLKASYEELEKKVKKLEEEVCQHHKVKNAFAELEKRYKNLVETTTNYRYSVEIKDGRQVSISHSPNCFAVTGYSAKEYDRDPELWEKRIHEKDRSDVASLLRKVQSGNIPPPFEHRIYHQDGSIRWLKISIIPRYSIQGPLKGYDTFVSDITELKNSETERDSLHSQLRQMQKMQAIGTLAGGIAHDFNNILGAILGFSSLAMDDIPEAHPARFDLEQVMIAGNRAKDLVRQILTFSRQAEQERRPLQIHLIVKEALKLLRASIPSTIEIHQHIDLRSGTIAADPTEIHQVVVNLCTNAYQSMLETGGILEVSLCNVQVDEETARLHHTLHAGNYVRLIVTDTGKGMESSVLDRIFEPYFTTKPVSEGTGLGLAVTHGIVMGLNGTITVQSKLGVGSSFTVYLPRLMAEPAKFIEDKSLPTNGGERILFVDDEEPLTIIGKTILERLGYNVTVRTSSIEALNAFKAQPNNFDLIMTDQMMPNMNGIQLCREIRRIRKDIPLILVTGFSEIHIEQQAEEAGIDNLVLKPLSPKEMGLIIRGVLDKTE